MSRIALVGLVPMCLGAVLLTVALGRPIVALGPQPASTPRGVSVPVEAPEHIDTGVPVVYRNRPPSSGPHYARTLRYGLYDLNIEPGFWVHTLEHGGVVILYRCVTACPDLVQQLRRVYAAAPLSQRYHVAKLAALPYDDMDHQIAAVAWGYVDEMDAFDSERLLAFYRDHLDKGPEDAL